MNWERILSVAVGAAATALVGVGIQQSAPPSVPAASYANVVNGLARMNAETRAEADRCSCKYLKASAAAVERGWKKPSLRSEWDALCAQSDEVAGR